MKCMFTHVGNFSPATSRLLAATLLLTGFVVQSTYAQDDVSFSKQELNAIAAQGPWPLAVLPDPGNELSTSTSAAQIGESLFFDTSLSAGNQVSCASCHQPDAGFSDNMPLAMGLKRGVRNTPGLLDIGLQRWFGWGGGTDSLWAASIRPMLNNDEMGHDLTTLAATLRKNQTFVSAFNNGLFTTYDSAVGNNNTDASSVADASDLGDLSDEEIVVLAGKSMAAYMLTLSSNRTKFDLFRDALINGNISEQAVFSNSEKRGLKLFVGEASCRSCHFGANFSNGEFHDIGRPFFTGKGQVDSGRYAGIQRVREDQFNVLGKFSSNSTDAMRLKVDGVKLGQVNWGQWRTPSLRNLALTAPYMHDGSLETLRDVVEFYNEIDVNRLHSKGETLLKPLNLSETQIDDLVNFLLTLSEAE